MDKEIKDILVKLLEGQTRLETDVNNIKDDINDMKSDINDMKSDINNMKADVNDMRADMSNMKSDINKNSIKLETMENKLDIIIEVQTAHKEQNERAFKEIDSKIEEKTNIIEAGTKSISKDLREVAESVEVLKDMTGRHEVDINILKRRPV